MCAADCVRERVGLSSAVCADCVCRLRRTKVVCRSARASSNRRLEYSSFVGRVQKTKRWNRVHTHNNGVEGFLAVVCTQRAHGRPTDPTMLCAENAVVGFSGAHFGQAICGKEHVGVYAVCK